MMRDIKEIEKRYRRRQESRGKINLLKKRYFVFLILVIAFVTNPSEDKLKNTLKSRIYKITQTKTIPQGEDDIFAYKSDMLVDQIIGSYVSYSNYFLFSTMDITWQGNTGIIGIGVFGYVYIPQKINELLINYKL